MNATAAAPDSATPTEHELITQRVFEAADRLFYERGIAGVGMDEVRDLAGVSLRRLYNMYPSKRDLVAAWLEQRHTRWMAWFIGSVEKRTTSGDDPVVAVFDAIEEWATSPNYRGCAFLNSIAETMEIDDSHRAIATTHKRELGTQLAAIAARCVDTPPPWLPGALGVLVDGAIVQSVVFQSTAPFGDARRAARQLVESLR